MKNRVGKKIWTNLLASVMLLTPLATTATACGGEEKSDVNALLRVAQTEDKILQTYADGTSKKEKLGETFYSYLEDEFSFETFRNEYESRTLIITPESNVNFYDVALSDFTCGDNVLPATAFDLRHQYYHEVSTVFSNDTDMLPGMYPDAMLPLSAAKEYKINTIRANENQGVLITLKTPENQPAGVYAGEITVTLNDTVKKMPATVEVLDYTLPNKVTAKACMPMSSKYLNSLEMNCTQEMYQKLCDSLNEFRLAPYMLFGLNVDANSEEVYRAMAKEHAVLMLDAAQDETVPSYGMQTNGKYKTYTDPNTGKARQAVGVHEEKFHWYMETYVEASIDNEVDLFKKAYVYMGTIIDEPEGNDTEWMVDTVCAEYNQLLGEIAAYAEEYAQKKGSTWDGLDEMIENIRTLNNVVTTWIDSHGDYKLVDTYCPEPQYYHSSAVVEDYRAHRENGGDYWWYTCCNPNAPYPTLHIDDNGVSARVMYWMMREYDIAGYLGWETIKTTDGYPNYSNPTTLNGIEQYEDVMRNNTDCGDAYYYYPGKVFGLDEPVPCLRFWNVRNGSEDYEAITDLENSIYPALSQAYGNTLSADGVLKELYATMYDMTKVYCSSQEVAYARECLNRLMVWANNGIAISDYMINSNGTTTAKVYAPQGVEVRVNGKLLSGVSAGSGMVYAVNETSDAITFDIVGKTMTIGALAEEIAPVSTSRVQFEGYDADGNLTALDTVPVEMIEYGATNAQTLHVKATEDVVTMLYALDDDDLSKDTKSLIIYVYYEGNEKIKATLSVYGRNVRGLDTVYIKPGYNQIRIDRIGDLEWSKIKDANYLIFEFAKPDTVQTFDLYVEKLLALK